MINFPNLVVLFYKYPLFEDVILNSRPKIILFHHIKTNRKINTEWLSIGVLRKAKAVKMEAERANTAWTHLAKFNLASLRLFIAKARRVNIHVVSLKILYKFVPYLIANESLVDGVT